MVIDVVNDDDQVIGTIPRRSVFGAHVGFRVAHVFLRNRSGDFLLQQLAPIRERNPEKWGSSVAAYLFAGEDYPQAAMRRVSQELGIDPPRLTLLKKLVMNDQGCHKHIALFSGVAEGPFFPDHSHISRLEYFSWTELLQLLRNHPQRFTPTFRYIMRSIEPALSG